MKKLIILALLLIIQGCASPQPQPLGATRSVTAFPTITPVDADYFIFSDVSNSSMFSRATLASTKTALGIALTAAGFNGNLTTTDDTLQEIAQKFDDAYTLEAFPSADNQVYQSTGSGTAAWTATIQGLIHPDAGDGDTDKLWSADTIFDLLAGKQAADADLTIAAGANSASLGTCFGMDTGGTVGFIPVSSGGFALDTYPTYEDSPHTGSGIAVNATTLAVYSPAASKWLTVGLTDSLDAAPDSFFVNETFETSGATDRGWVETGVNSTGDTDFYFSTTGLSLDGDYALKLFTTSGGYVSALSPDFASDQTTVYFAFKFRTSALPAFSMDWVRARDASNTELMRIRTDSSGQLGVSMNGGDSAYSTTVLSANTTYWLKGRYTAGSGTAVASAYLHNGSSWDLKATVTTQTRTESANHIEFKMPSVASATQVYYDSVQAGAADF